MKEGTLTEETKEGRREGRKEGTSQEDILKEGIQEGNIEGRKEVNWPPAPQPGTVHRGSTRSAPFRIMIFSVP